MRTEAERRVVALLRRHAEPLPDPDEAGAAGPFARAFERFAGARVVLLGEATHGTSEFYRARAAITRHLIERHGFGIVLPPASGRGGEPPSGARSPRPAAPGFVRRQGGHIKSA